MRLRGSSCAALRSFHLRLLTPPPHSSYRISVHPPGRYTHFTPQVQPIFGAADMCGVALGMMAGPRFWLAGVVLAPAMSLLPDITYMTFQRTFAPKLFQIYQVRLLLRAGWMSGWMGAARAARQDVGGPLSWPDGAPYAWREGAGHRIGHVPPACAASAVGAMREPTPRSHPIPVHARQLPQPRKCTCPNSQPLAPAHRRRRAHVVLLLLLPTPQEDEWRRELDAEMARRLGLSSPTGPPPGQGAAGQAGELPPDVEVQQQQRR